MELFNCAQIKLLVEDSNTWNHFTECKHMSFGSSKNCYLQTMYLRNIYLIYVYTQNLILSNLHVLICCKSQLPNKPTLPPQTGCDTRSIFQWVLLIWIQNFSSPWWIAMPRVKSPDYVYLGVKVMDSCFSWEH